MEAIYGSNAEVSLRLEASHKALVDLENRLAELYKSIKADINMGAITIRTYTTEFGNAVADADCRLTVRVSGTGNTGTMTNEKRINEKR